MKRKLMTYGVTFLIGIAVGAMSISLPQKKIKTNTLEVVSNTGAKIIKKKAIISYNRRYIELVSSFSTDKKEEFFVKNVVDRRELLYKHGLNLETFFFKKIYYWV